VLVLVGSLFCVAWAIGLLTIGPQAGWFVHLPLLVGSAAILYGVARWRRIEI
jgi:hypothetical protein